MQHLPEADPVDATGSLTQRLVEAFSPPLDSALVAAIASDYPSTSEGEADVRGVLEALAAEATAAEVEADREREVEVERAFEAWSLQEEALDADLVDAASSTTGSVSASASAPSTATNVTGSDVDDVTTSGGDNRLADSSEAAVTFLRSLFPARSDKILRDAVEALPPAGSPDAGLDLSAIVEQFLTEDFLASSDSLAALDSSAPGSPALDSGSELPNGAETASARRRRKKREQATKRGLQTISLTDVMHTDLKRRYAAAAAADSEDEGVGPGVSAFLRGKEVDNRWVTLDSQANYVGRLLDVSAGTVTSAYHQADSNLVLALDRLTRQLMSEREATSTPPEAQAHESVVAELVASPPLGPPRTSAELLQLSHLTRADADAARELVAFLDGLARKHGSVSWNGLVHGGSATESARTANRKPRLAAGNGSVGSGSEAELDPEPLQASASEYLAQAARYRAKRDSAFRTAASSFQSSKSRGGLQGAARKGESAYWAEEGRKWDAKVKACEMKAARARVEERKKARGAVDGYVGGGGAPAGGTIDLHGLTLNQALTVTKEQVNIWWTSEANPPPLRIVTGAGRHSLNSNPILLPAVIKLLDREGWQWKYDQAGGDGTKGAVLVRGVVRR